ncbi:MAG: OB-fold domain-containing protein [Candidatus Dormibacteraeota bacterium]|nr:OB-fold domain-containing protein [Candidatus Dormibacteraeota bacterium]MBO0703764.1 OB-fold domain-containing protein [Candidatus Dormibacteraeota bacterium]MBO0759864.1 OB-fold domain-containing protein [Candidatus Dormibacteraeota bacterium]
MTELVRPRPRQDFYEVPFWEHVEQRRLSLQRCSACGRFRYPPGPVCPDCLGDGFEWVPLRGAGRLISWVVFHRQYFPELPVPYHVGAVEVAEGPILIANLVHLDGVEPRLDLPVRVTYETARDHEGRRWTIYQFEPGPQWEPDSG